MTRVVIDPSVLVSALIGSSSGAPARLVAAVREGRVVMLASPALLEELTDVLRRPKFAKWTAESRGERYIDGLTADAHIVPDPAETPPATRDADDDYLVALAVSCEAEAIVSLDRDLLDARLPVPCLAPGELIRELR